MKEPEILDKATTTTAISDGKAAGTLVEASFAKKAATALGIPGLSDSRTEEQDIGLRREAAKLMALPLPSRGEVDRNYFRPVPIGDLGVHVLGKELGEHVPQSKLDVYHKKMMPKDWEAAPVRPPDPSDVEFLEFWHRYFRETGEAPLWTDLEEYDLIRTRAFGSPKRGERKKRRGFQVTGRYCKKPQCGGEVRCDPDARIEQCFGCGETVVLEDRRLRKV